MPRRSAVVKSENHDNVQANLPYTISRVEGDRRRIYTARYTALIKGKLRGGFEAGLDEVGSGPLEALHELLALVPVRADDEDPPTQVETWRWFPPLPAADDGRGEAAGTDD